jgi:hypothetical protein
MILCPICGIDFIPYTNGRTKIYCSINCANYNKYKNALEKTLLALRPTKESKKIIKGDMFRLSNLITCSTKTLSKKND